MANKIEHNSLFDCCGHGTSWIEGLAPNKEIYKVETAHFNSDVYSNKANTEFEISYLM